MSARFPKVVWKQHSDKFIEWLKNNNYKIEFKDGGIYSPRITIKKGRKIYHLYDSNTNKGNIIGLLEAGNVIDKFYSDSGLKKTPNYKIWRKDK